MNYNQRFYLVTYCTNHQKHFKTVIADSQQEAISQFHRERAKFAERNGVTPPPAIIVSADHIEHLTTIKTGKRL
jgi:hypothetical protein